MAKHIHIHLDATPLQRGRKLTPQTTWTATKPPGKNTGGHFEVIAPSGYKMDIYGVNSPEEAIAKAQRAPRKVIPDAKKGK